MKKIKIIMSVRAISKSYPKGAYFGKILQGSKSIKQKDGNINAHGEDKAYSLVVDWCKEMGKVYNAEVQIKPKSALDKMLSNPKSHKPKVKVAELKPVSNALLALDNHPLTFRATIKNAYKVAGYDRVKRILATGLKVLEELHEGAREIELQTSTAKLELAKSMFKIFKDTGINIIETVADKEVIALYKKLSSAPAGINAPEKLYFLNGIKWDGSGNAPTNYKKWRVKNHKDNYEELRIN